MADMIERMKSERDGAVERGLVMLEAKNYWMERARVAEAALSQEREARDEANARAARMSGDWFEFCEMMGENFDTQEAVAYSINAKISNLEASLAEAKRLLKTARDRIDMYADTADEHCLVAEIDDLLAREPNHER